MSGMEMGPLFFFELDFFLQFPWSICSRPPATSWPYRRGPAALPESWCAFPFLHPAARSDQSAQATAEPAGPENRLCWNQSVARWSSVGGSWAQSRWQGRPWDFLWRSEWNLFYRSWGFRDALLRWQWLSGTLYWIAKDLRRSRWWREWRRGRFLSRERIE